MFILSDCSSYESSIPVWTGGTGTGGGGVEACNNNNWAEKSISFLIRFGEGSKFKGVVDLN